MLFTFMATQLFALTHAITFFFHIPHCSPMARANREVTDRKKFFTFREI
jgi:hypothetical protein